MTNTQTKITDHAGTFVAEVLSRGVWRRVGDFASRDAAEKALRNRGWF